MKFRAAKTQQRSHCFRRNASARRFFEQANQLGGGQDGQQHDADAGSCLSELAPGGALEYHALTKPKKCEDNPSNTDISLIRSSLWNLA
jgi:hypothetical protein